MTAVPNANAKFNPGFQSEQIALKSIPGTPVHSHYQGEQILFILADNRRWFTDPSIAQRIEKMRIQPGEIFEIQKVSRRQGSKAITEIELTAHVPIPETAKKPVGGAVSASGEGTSATHLNRCYRDAVDIVAVAVEYARSKGLSLAPDFADIRALAATICISETNGRRAA